MKMKFLIMMICCLLLATPYIGGESVSNRETEIPAAHSVYRVNGTVRKSRVKLVRENCLLSEEDTSNFPRGSLNKDTGKVTSLLPPSPPKGVQTPKSLLAYSVRKTLKACDEALSKKQIRRLLTSLFPSRSRLNREMRAADYKWKDGGKEVYDDYHARQQALYTTLQAWTFAGPNAEQEALEKRLYAEAQELNKRQQALGGYVSLSDKRIEHTITRQSMWKEIDSLEHTLKSGQMKFENVRALLMQEPTINGEVALGISKVLPTVSPQQVEGQNAKKVLATFERESRTELQTLEEKIKKLKEAEEFSWTTSDLVVMHEAEEVTLIQRRLEEIAVVQTNICNTRVNAYTLDDVSHAFIGKEPWASYADARGFLGTLFVEENIQSSDWAFFTHPAIALPNHITIDDVQAAAILSHGKDETIPEVVIKLSRQANYTTKNLMRLHKDILLEKTLSYGLPTITSGADDNNRQLTKKQLADQLVGSFATWEVPNAVESELGVAFNDLNGESNWFSKSYDGLYSFAAPTKKAAKKAQAQSDFNEFMAEMGF